MPYFYYFLTWKPEQLTGMVYIYAMPYFYYLPYYSLFSSFISVFNVAILVTSGYLDKKFIVLCHTSLTSKNDWANMLSVVGDYSRFPLPPFFLLLLPICFFFSISPTTEVEGCSSPWG